MNLKPRVTAEQAAENLAEIEPKYTPQEAKVEADRCLYCFDAPCIMACPTGIDIPGFIKKIANHNLTGSARTILESNVLGASCARVCPTSVLCEGACVMLDRDKQPIKIGRLQRYAVDHVMDNDIQVLKPAAKKLGKKVALVGGGPASLGCAAELARLGYDATIYEKKPEAGGLNTYGIAYYKLTPEVSLKEVELVKSLGVEIKTGVEVGKDVTMEDLLASHDAVFLGIGLGHTYRLDVPGEDLPEVFEALEFIEEIHTKPLDQVAVGARVVVIGCGNTAIDAVTQAKRLGADDAKIVYRRGENDMPAYSYEYDIAKKDGCSFLFHALPVEILGQGHVTGIRLARTEPDGKGGVKVVAGSEFDLPCDMVIKALGQEKQVNLLNKLLPGLELDRSGKIVCDPATMQTNLPKVFTGGDAINGGREVVNAVADGKKAARGIHRALAGETVEGPVQATRLGAIGKPTGSGFDKPVRVPELEQAFFGA
ncbi:MAG TPA: NAD(P)-dependent oxidoreductase [Kiritimatiellia bacterium]|nr:NAD(P)-dependent oxidoreductase [Kiritimatiellia bacterium]